jgi:CTP:molybdopterin cytidylyltransferase MocA
MTVRAHAALLLAAGGSRRLGTAKQLLRVEGEPLVRRAARALLATRPTALFVVVGARADEVYAAVADLGASVHRVDCADWQHGLSSSLRAGIAALPEQVDSALVALCDQPAMNRAHLEALVQQAAQQPGRAVASGYAGVVGVPALLPRAWFQELLGLSGDVGARELLRRHADRVDVIEAPALAFDIDEPEDRSTL